MSSGELPRAAPSVDESALVVAACPRCGQRALVPVWACEPEDTGYCSACERLVDWREVE